MNNVNLIGRLVKDIEIRNTPSGKMVTSFCIAVANGKDKPSFFIDCVAWDKVAENLCKFFHKGDKLGVSGLLTTRSYEVEGTKRKVTEVLVNSFDFCNDSKGAEQPQAAAEQPQPDEQGNLPFEI